MPSNLAEKEQAQLEQQFTQRIAWWSMKRWCDVIYIPSPSKGVSLLTCDVKDLTSVTLFNLTPAQLEAKIQIYKEKPVWRRWLQRCFRPISQQIEALSYYKKCLNFRDEYLSEQNLSLKISTLAEQPSDTQPSATIAVSTTKTLCEKKIKEIEEWMEKSRNDLKTKIFQDNSEKALIFNNFFEQKLIEFNNLFIEPLLDSVDWAQKNEEEKEELSKTIIKIYRKGNLFFHPDSNRDIISSALESDREKLERSWNNIFNQSKKDQDFTKDKLIKKFGCNRNEITRLFEQLNENREALNKMIKQLKTDFQQFNEKSEKKSKEIEERIKKKEFYKGDETLSKTGEAYPLYVDTRRNKK